MIHEQKQHKQQKHIKQQIETNNKHGKRNVTAISTNIKQHLFYNITTINKQEQEQHNKHTHNKENQTYTYIHKTKT